MIKLYNIFKEMISSEEISPRKLTNIIRSEFNKKYNAKLYVKFEDYLYISTHKNPAQILWGGMEEDVEDEFFLALMAEIIEDEENNTKEFQIMIANGWSGKYTGVIKNSLNRIYESFAKNLKRTLIIDNDVSGGEWKHIAKSLNAEYTNNDY